MTILEQLKRFGLDNLNKPKRDAWMSVNGVTTCVNCNYRIGPGDMACPHCFPGVNHTRSKFYRDPFTEQGAA